MTKINFVIDDVSEQQFRRAAFKPKGTKRGYLSGALEEVTRQGHKTVTIQHLAYSIDIGL